VSNKPNWYKPVSLSAYASYYFDPFEDDPEFSEIYHSQADVENAALDKAPMPCWQCPDIDQWEFDKDYRETQ
jgi:hypothetical protein